MIAKAFSHFLSKRGLIWTGAALLSAVAIPAVGATASHLAHHRTHSTQRTASHSTALHHTAKPLARSAAMTAQKATRMAKKSSHATSLASVSSMHSGHVSAPTSSKLATTSHNSTAKKLSTSSSTSHLTHGSATHLTTSKLKTASRSM